MGQFFDEIPSFLIPWIQKQEVFWVATAPLSAQGHVNLSSKGLKGTFHVVDSHRVWYEDMTGSGVETIAHLRENGRITVLFNAFEGPPRIARIFGTGSVFEFGSAEYTELLPPEVRNPGSRAVIIIDVEKVGTSCGYGVPFFEFKGHRETYYNVAERLEKIDLIAQEETKPGENVVLPEHGMRKYLASKNAISIDGLTALTIAHEAPRACTIVEKRRSGSRVSVLTAAVSKKLKIDRAGEIMKVIQLPDLRFLGGIFVGLLLATMYSHVAKDWGYTL